MNLNILITLLIVVLVAVVVLSTIPKKDYVDKNSYLNLTYLLGYKQKMPLKELVVKEMPSGATEKLIRSFGTSIGKKSSGKFYNPRLKKSFIVFITGNKKLKYFEYQGKSYIVDDWEE